MQRRRKTSNHLELFHKPSLSCIAEIRAMTGDGWGHHWSPTHAELPLETTHSLHQGCPCISPAVQDTAVSHTGFQIHPASTVPSATTHGHTVTAAAQGEQKEILGGSSKPQRAAQSPQQQSSPGIFTSSPATIGPEQHRGEP